MIQQNLTATVTLDPIHLGQELADHASVQELAQVLATFAKRIRYESIDEIVETIAALPDDEEGDVQICPLTPVMVLAQTIVEKGQKHYAQV